MVALEARLTLIVLLQLIFSILDVDDVLAALDVETVPLFGQSVKFRVEALDGLCILQDVETADQRDDVEIGGIGLASLLLQFLSLLKLFELGELGILCLGLLDFLLQLLSLFLEAVEVLNRSQHVVRCDVDHAAAVVHGSAVGLLVELEDGSAER